MRALLYILSASIFSSQIGSAQAANPEEGGIWTQLCGSGAWIQLDLGNDKDTPERPLHAKICHALCCSDDEGEDCEKSDAKT